MSLEPGRTLAHFEIVEPIGKGGMGEVYRAHDSNLGRDVAIKVLPEEFSRDAERLARFKREAKVLASLNHPNIAAIHGLEESDGTHYLVLELVPGETLAERIARGPMPTDEAVAIAIEIAEGLEEAHEQGVVHRDLKPANIKLTPDDKVKILDFGLAKAFVDDAPHADESMSPTITRDATRVGVILGTAAYMSPEQAKGKRVDRRTDIFAFGAVLYEMLTGNKAFRGETVPEVLAAVMKDDPDWSALPSGSVQRVISRCLTKPSRDRFQHIGDARIALHEPDLAAAPAESRAHRLSMLVLATTILAAGVAVWTLTRSEALDSTSVARWRIPLPAGTSLGSNGPTSPHLAISPDGRHLAFVGMHDGNGQVFVKTAEAIDATPIDGAVNATMPFFSADGLTLGFLSETGVLMRVSFREGLPVAIADTGLFVRGASWSLDQNITFASNSGSLLRVPADGGASEVVAEPDRGARVKGLWAPDPLPRGDAVLLTVADLDMESYDEASIAALFPETGELRVLVRGGFGARYSSTGHLVYARSGSLYAVAFDASTVEVSGDPVRVLEGIASYPTMGHGEFSLSRNGSLLYAPGEPLNTKTRVVWVDRTGRATTLLDDPRPHGQPRISPDGRTLAFASDGANMSVWRYDFAEGALARIASGGNNSTPVWAPGSARLAFASDRNGGYDIFSLPVDGSGVASKLVRGEHHQEPVSWAPDGRTLLFRQRDARTGSDLWLLTASGETMPLLATMANEREGDIAPSGLWLAFESDESGRPEIYVCDFPNAESRRRVSVNGGTAPRWSPNGRELFFRNGTQMVVVNVDAADGLKLGDSRVLFESDEHYAGNVRQYDVSADGERFVMVDMSAAPQPPTELMLVQNWAKELKRLVPTDK